MSLAQAQFSDDFSDGDFTSNPTWSGMDTSFTIDANFRLQLDAPAVTSESFLSTPSLAIYDAEWQFDVALDFNPSGSNRAYIYLTSSNADLSQSLNGYYVLIGNSSDEVSLYRQSGASSSKIIDGVDGLVDVSTPNVRVRVTRDVTGNWELFADTSTSFTNEVSQGTVNDATHGTSSYFGVLCDYTSTRSDKFFLDNFVVTGIAVPDIVEPQVDSVVVVSGSELQVYFSEELSVTSAEEVSNYSISGGLGNPQTATWNSSDFSVTLNLTNSLQPNVAYDLSVSNVEDIAGNIMIATTIPVLFEQPIILNYRDVVINEVLRDPDPVVGLPESEFVELLNNTNQTIPLGSLTFSDRTTTASLPNILLPPNGYIILCASSDSALLAPFGQVVPLSPWPSLNNGDEDLSLAQNGTIIDQISYDDSWYETEEKEAGGWSLEQVNPNLSCSGASNWKESDDSSGGTPGTVNSVFSNAPDVTAPEVQIVTQLGPNQIEVFVNEPLDTLATAAIIITTSPSIGAFQIDYTSISSFTVTFTNSFEIGVTYDLSINGLTDCAGNLQSEAFTIEIGNGISPKPFDIVINEIYSIPGEGILQEEFVELYNTTDSLIKLDDLYFADASSSVQLPSIAVAPNSYVVLIGGTSTGSDPRFENGTWFIPYSSFPSLNNAGDDLELGNALNGQLIDQVSYSNSWYKDADKGDGGYSLERKNPFDVCAGSSNWEEPINAEHTQGLENTWFNPATPEDIQWVAAQWASDSTIRIDASGKVAEGSFSVSTSPAIQIDSVVPTDVSETSFLIYFSDEIDQTNEYFLTISVGSDCKGDDVASSTFLLKAAQAGDIVINEVLFNPVTGGSDYVELFNNSNDTINLNSWGFHYLNSNDELQVAELSDTAMLIYPGEYQLFTENVEQTLLQYPDGRVTQMHDIDLPSFANDAGRVTLASNLGDTIDDFSYSEDYHFDLLRDVDGVSLERLDPSRKTNDPTNWHSASEFVNYGTPGYENSQFVLASFEDKVTVSPETFSPDEDGRDDVVTISFKLEQPGYVANISIYDPNGTKVRELVNNRLLGTQDAVSWNGIRDDGQKADIGIYLIYIELFDLSGDTKHYKETCVLATRF
jgi:hypothetical protein